MFRKVQLKFFGIITAILIAIFIVLLVAINLIMDMVMERQSQTVLQQVAAGVEYDIKTAQFTLTDPDIYYNDHGKGEEPPPKPESTAPTTVSTETQSSETETTTETTTETSGEQPHEQPSEEHRDPTPPPEHHDPEPTQPPQPSEPETTEPWTVPADWGWGWGWWYPWGWGYPPQDTTDPNQGGNNGVPNGGYDGSWWNNYGGAVVRDKRPHYPLPEYVVPDPTAPESEPESEPEIAEPQSYEGGGVIAQLTYENDKPVLDGYTIEDSDPPPKPNRPLENENFAYQVPKSLGSIDFFIIMADTDGQYLAKLNNDDMDDELAQKYTTMILHDKNPRGMADNYQYHRELKDNGILMVLTDRTAEIDMMKKLKRTTFLVGMISVILLSVGAYFLSGIIVRPLQDTFDKQKQFISDASHELKTPLTVISTNADVLSGEIGDNKWLKYIQDQAARMNILVNDLLSLTRLENNSSNFKLTYFSLSQAILSTALPFECQAFESGKNFVVNVDDGINLIASEQHVRQMAGIFIDNALKYSKEQGTVRVSLTKEDGRAVLSVFNTGSGVKEEEKYRIFERFYRSDESRNRATGGYGLGLAIAKSIIDKHKFKLTVDNHEGTSICFIITM